MPIQIKLASTNEEYDAVFRLRHEVMVGDGYAAPRSDARIHDRFDAFPTTRLIIALIEGEVVGTVRTTLDSGAGTSVDAFYDFSAACPPSSTVVAAGSHFHIAPSFRKHFQLSTLLMGMFHYWLRRQGGRYVKGVMNPQTVSLMQRIGYAPIDQPRISPHDSLSFVPVLLDMERLRGPVGELVVRQPDLGKDESFHRWYYSEGEPLTCPGDFMILQHGEVTIVPAGSHDSGSRCNNENTLHPGDEIAPHLFQTSALVAKSEVEVAILSPSK